MFVHRILNILFILILPGVSASEILTREATGWGADRDSAVNYALKSAQSQIVGEDARLLSYEIESEKPPQEQYWVALKVDFPSKSLPRAEGYGDDRQLAIQDALSSAVAMVCGVDISVVQLSEKTEINTALFEYYDQKTDSRISGRVSSYEIIDEKPKQMVYQVRLRVQFRTFDTWRTVCYSILPGGGLIYKQRKLMGFAYVGAEVAMLTAAFFNMEKAEDYHAKKSNPNYNYEERDFYYDQETKYNHRNQIFMGLALGVYALNFAHALLVDPKTNEDLFAFADPRYSEKVTCIPYITTSSGMTGIGIRIQF